jgi:hypothetical protein
VSDGLPVSVEWVLRADDYVAAQALHNRWTDKRALFSLGAIAVGIVIVGFAVPWAHAIGFGLIGGAVGGGLAFELVRRFAIPRRARRLFAQQKGLQRPKTLRWDAAGLSWKSEQGEATTPWSDFLKYKESDRLYVLYLSDALFLMVPKRVFPDDVLAQSFATMVHRIPVA